MDHYIDIRLRPDPEFSAQTLLSALYSKLHRALVARSSDNIGISFPEYAPRRLGQCLRLHGTRAALTELGDRWLAGMRDHCEVAPIQPVPADAAHRRLIRVQAKSSPARLRRRHMRRHGVTAAQAQGAIPDNVAERLDLPFIRLRSTSTAQSFPLFLLRSEQEPAQPGSFNAYGLSQAATVPWF